MSCVSSGFLAKAFRLRVLKAGAKACFRVRTLQCLGRRVAAKILERDLGRVKALTCLSTLGNARDPKRSLLGGL